MVDMVATDEAVLPATLFADGVDAEEDSSDETPSCCETSLS